MVFPLIAMTAALLQLAPLQVTPTNLICNDAVDSKIPHPAGALTVFFAQGYPNDGFATSLGACWA